MRPKPRPVLAPVVLALLVSAGAAACGAADPGVNAISSARAAIGTLKLQLRQRLQLAMAEGPAHALDVCAGEAQAIRGKIAHDSQTALGRSSLRLRTPADAPPDWVRAWLDTHGEKKAAGVEGFARIDQTPEGPVARVLEPIAIEKGCLACHGPADRLAPGVRDALAARYPTDTATGYAEGDLRGAIWAERPVR